MSEGKALSEDTTPSDPTPSDSPAKPLETGPSPSALDFPPPATPSYRLGLRAQLVLALSVAFGLAFLLLGTAAVELGRRSREAARRDDAQAAANTLAAAMEVNGSRSAFLQYCDAALGHGGIRGVEVVVEGAPEPWTRGVTHLGDAITDQQQGTVTLWVRAPDHDGRAFGGLMLIYLSVTVGAILLLTFVALTRLIVRPLESLTGAARRVATGRLNVAVPERGASEIATLATSFNAMARELAAEKRALESRLEELEQTTQELKSAEQRVERSAHLASVGRLAAGVAHEIGNPLTAIGGLVELAQSDDLETDERREFLRRVEAETGRIQRIIRELLDFARPPGEGLDSIQTVDLAEVVEGAVHLVAPQRDAGKVRIEQRLEPGCVVRGNVDGLTQVLLNLLLNAADAMNGEGEILVELHRDGATTYLAVTDSGPGIAPEMLDTLFEPFVTSKDAGHGTGLGLAVCHSIVARFGGNIQATNTGEGARFEVRLPTLSPSTPPA